ncbi:MAG: 1-(5-phosphoribosyl)-5-[(5-phosphoribosylamino)methylideneamino]imidazole-4-carboxamide isomerase [Helicobacter sp.]|uniref:1-(5-phosphoribosyl)-5-[(5- phosphoribosylamino)methylideneamino]imidazole-4- carboxamide isomerase n=1 Tax=Helicobacter sp. 10-6591 TaxID=2004998 RepID=UPI000DCD2FDD|nr:1-(5-phosphoribosyl)-5-[(5-phosphoribosylamino)methylideneamino]imidazole-4-carboxamide isomerase [Helicobacter sp. 10-6591]MCI6217548.1 1-(5-phosphoribosyl)-5-[(5-phosphoribosylamino)methylideneamino]imidazole-4-carboxamide isomerase [Helicobacter sp.]RAX55520.1 1-(5-phosphoribosyl)-5-[(5-phosphoribosylamino)methylideneamino]imidazole-4-carboxamide isomerase [Helicobacter sp. 10-6591]
MLDIYPAIDLKDGHAVRLSKGQMENAKIYGKPIDFALKFEEMGAKWLHIVDLNGAFTGEPENLKCIKEIAKHTKLNIQIGGGIRTQECIARYVDMGIKRVILGSVALKDRDFTLAMAQKYPVAVGIDSRNGKVAIEGWAHNCEILAFDFAKEFRGSKIEAIICTDIERDGVLSGINVQFTESIAKNSGIYTIASGGFANTHEFEILEKNPFIKGVIIGKAFYEQKIDLGRYLKNTQKPIKANLK